MAPIFHRGQGPKVQKTKKLTLARQPENQRTTHPDPKRD